MKFGDVFGEKVDGDGVLPVVVVPTGQVRGRAAVGTVNLLVSVVKGGAVLRVASEKSKVWYSKNGKKMTNKTNIWNFQSDSSIWVEDISMAFILYSIYE